VTINPLYIEQMPKPVTPSNKKSPFLGNTKKGVIHSSPVVKKPQWNSYLTEDDKFKLSNEEILKKKQLLLSKNNILTSPLKSVVRKRQSSSAKNKKSQMNNNLTPGEVSSDEESDILLDKVAAKSLSNKEYNFTSDDDNYDSRDDSSQIRRHSTPISRPVYSQHLSKTKSEKTNAMSRNTELDIQEKDMREIGSMIEQLNNELMQYEEISGRRSAVPLSVGDVSDWANENPTSVLKYMIQLVRFHINLYNNTICL
jgi:hypothetical protein